MDRLEPLLERLKAEKIHTAVETCLFAPAYQLSIAIKYIDLFYVDIKILDKEKTREYLRGDLSVYHINLQKLLISGKTIVFRIPLLEDIQILMITEEK